MVLVSLHYGMLCYRGKVLSRGEEGTSEPGSNDLDGGGGDNSDGQDEEESAVKVSCY